MTDDEKDTLGLYSHLTREAAEFRLRGEMANAKNVDAKIRGIEERYQKVKNRLSHRIEATGAGLIFLQLKD